MESESPSGRSAWIVSPALDLLVGCGAWSLPLLVLAYPFRNGDVPGWTMAFYGLALIFNYPHYMATIYRAYHTKEDFRRYAVFTIYLTGVLAVALIAAHWSYRIVPILFTIYITWSPWHYMGQNFGLSMMFIRRNGIEIDRKDRDALWTAFVASYLMIFLSFHSNPSSDPYVLSLGLPSLLDIFRIPLLAVFVVLGVWPLAKLVRKFGWRPMTAPLALYVTEFLWFVLPTVLELTSGFRVPQTRYAAGILAVMHSAQYLWITSYYAKQEAQAAARPWKWQGYFAILALGGIALFVPGPWLASYVLHGDFASSFLIFTALVNIHHFILDGAVWKLREKRVASMLIETKSARPVTSLKAALPSPALSWRFAKVAGIVALIALAGLDQVRYDLGVRSGGVTGLVRAAALNPWDSVLQMRIGKAYASSGQPDLMERALRESIRINPYNRDAQNAMARLLVEDGRFDEAYTHYNEALKYIRPDAATLVNYGMLCMHRDEIAEAVAAFKEAIEISPGYAPAHLYLGNIIQSEGDVPAAIAHYERCVDMGGKAGNPDLVTACNLKLQTLRK